VLRSLVLLLVLPLAAAACASGASRAQKPPVTHEGVGVVVDVNVEKGRIKINHEKIEGYMEPMTMWFSVKDPALLEGLQPSDKVAFTVAEEDSADVIVELRKR
jgi:Cu/Ag efflux protein CusF